MYELDCAFRRFDGGIRFIRESRFNEARDDLCEMQVDFHISEIFPAEDDTGAEMDYRGGISQIRMRGYTGEWRRWRVLRGDDLAAAITFLEEEYAEELHAAEAEHAEAVYYGEAA